MPIFYHILALVLCLHSAGAAQAEIPLRKFNGIEYFSKHVEVFEDVSGDLRLADVLRPEYDRQFRMVKSEKDLWRGKSATSAYWFRLKLLNTSQESDWFFRYWGSLNRSVKVYLAAAGDGDKGNNFKLLQATDYAQGPTYSLRLTPNLEYILYYRIQDNSIALQFGPYLEPVNNFIKSAYYYYPWRSFLIGGLFILALYNFLYFLHLRDKSFLVLALFIFSFTLEMAGHTGLWHAVTWMRQYLDSIGWLFGFLCIAFAILLVRQWFNTAEYQPRFDRFWHYTFWLSIAWAAASVVIPLGSVVLITWGSFLITVGLLNVLLFIQEGRRLPIAIILAGAVFLVTMIPSILFVFDISIGINMVAESSIVGLLLSLALLSIHQASQMRRRNEQIGRVAAANQARDEFLTTMSHELRTPMSSVVSAGQLLNLSPLSTDQSEYVSRLNTSSEHMLSLINNVLDLARLDQQSHQAEKIPFKLHDILQQLEHLLAEQTKGRAVKLVMEDRFHLLNKQLLGDPTWLRQILLNLLSNAFKFTEKGEVRLTITPQAMDTASVTLLFEVRDTGIGIAKDRQAELFQPFSQADSSTARVYGGSGLGLVISHKFVKRMGGVLQLDSELGQGCRFYFTLCFLTEDIVPEKKQSLTKASPALSRGKYQALLVDDNEMNRFFNSRILKSLGVDVTAVDSGKQGLECLQSGSFDVIFIDVNMPEMDGYEAASLARQTLDGKTIKIIALTAHAISGERQRCLAAGMDDYLPKPYTRQALENVLSQHGLLAPLASVHRQ